MTTITIATFKGPESHQLTAREILMFQTELRRVRGGWFNRWLARLLAPRVRQHLTAPDCLIRVEENGQVQEWELHGGYVLREKGHVEVYTFYLGYLMLRWLYGPNP
ncbi:MAG TPA: hypothetical protein VG734_20205 [Lacunisphaera sp.]|nr:hypothetical protein [Lacunisphaera sp.]